MSLEKNAGQNYKSLAEIEEVARRFEACAFGADDFKHREHLAAAFWYLTQLPTFEAAADAMRTGLIRFLSHHAHDAALYHETITLFWLKLVRHLLDRREPAAPLVPLANEIIERCADAKLIYRHYSKEHLMSEAGRRGWVEPDLRPLDF